MALVGVKFLGRGTVWNIGKERPKCRRFIIEQAYRPEVEKGKFTGRAHRKEGGFCWLSDGLRRQMRRMIAEGYWLELVQ